MQATFLCLRATSRKKGTPRATSNVDHQIFHLQEASLKHQLLHLVTTMDLPSTGTMDLPTGWEKAT
jgi:hypothetical protein